MVDLRLDAQWIDYAIIALYFVFVLGVGWYAKRGVSTSIEFFLNRPEVYDLWLSKVREARPVYGHGWQSATLILALPVTGVIGWSLLVWLWMYAKRIPAMTKAKIDPQDARFPGSLNVLPDDAPLPHSAPHDTPPTDAGPDSATPGDGWADATRAPSQDPYDTPLAPEADAPAPSDPPGPGDREHGWPP